METTKISQEMQHFFRLLGLKIIPAYFYEKNPTAVKQWQFSLCRQTAVIVAAIIQELGVNCEIWEGFFFNADLSPDKAYDHAWNYIPEYDIILDVTSTYPYIVSGLGNNPIKALNSMGITNTKLVQPQLNQTFQESIKQINLMNMLNQVEFFTQLYGFQVMYDIKAILIDSNLLPSPKIFINE